MAVTATITYDLPKRSERISRNLAIATGLVTTTGTYATNGFDLGLKDAGLRNVFSVDVHDGGGYVYVYDQSTDYVKVYRSAAIAAQTTNLIQSANVAGKSLHMSADGTLFASALSTVGIETVAAVSQATFVEFTNGAAFATTFRFVAFGTR